MCVCVCMCVCMCVFVCESLTFVTTPDTIMGAFGGLKKKKREKGEKIENY